MTKKDSSRKGELRCLNCFARFSPDLGVERLKCPKCSIEWRISWPSPQMAKIRGPVWNTYPGTK